MRNSKAIAANTKPTIFTALPPASASPWRRANSLPPGFPRSCGRWSATAFTPCSIRHCSPRSLCARRRAGWHGSRKTRCAHAPGCCAGCQSAGSRSCARRCHDAIIPVAIRSKRWGRRPRVRRMGRRCTARFPARTAARAGRRRDNQAAAWALDAAPRSKDRSRTKEERQ
jgi:hypothetical protein